MSISPHPLAERPPKRSAGRPHRDVAGLISGSILAAARELFLTKGFAATSVQEIADRAGVTKRTLYVKIGDKEAIFGAVVRAMLQDWRHVVDGAGPDSSLELRFEHVGQLLLGVMLDPDMVRLNRVMLAEAYRFPSMVSLLVSQIEQGPIPQLARLLLQARGATGEPAESDQIAARLFYDMITGAPMRVALTGRPPSLDIAPDAWVRSAVTLFLQGWRDVSRVPA